MLSFPHQTWLGFRGTVTARRYISLGSVFAFAVGVAYLVPKMLSTDDGLDFRLIWLAGSLWTKSLSPYDSQQFTSEYELVFGPGPITHFWVYPPYWIALSAPLSQVPFHSALLIWNVANIALLALTAWLTAERMQGPGAPRRTLFTAIFAFGAFLQATPFALAIGQTSFLVAAGAALFIKGYVEHRSSNAWLACGVALLMLKPQVGVVALCLLALRPSSWRAVATAGAICGAFSLIALLLSGFQETVGGFLTGLGDYGDEEYLANQPANLTGLVNLWSLVSPSVPPYGLFSALAGALAVAATAFVKDMHDRCLIMFGAVMALVPLHTYDFVLAIVMTPLLLRKFSSALWATAGFLLLFRCGNLASVLELAHPQSTIDFDGSLLASLATILLLGGAMAAATAKR